MMKKAALFILFCVSALYADKAGEYYSQFVKAYKNGDKASAAKYIEKAYNENPSNNNILQWYGNILNENKKYDEAIKIWKKISPEYSPVTVHSSLAGAYKSIGDYGAAEQRYYKILSFPDVKPNEELNAVSGLMGIYQAVPDDEKALALERKLHDVLIANSDIKGEWACYMISKYLIGRAVEFAKGGKEKEGFEFYNLVMKYYHAGLGKYTNNIAPEFFGYEWMKQEKYALAETVFCEVFQLRNNNYLTWAYSETLRKMGNPVDAIEICVKGLKKPGGDPKMYGWIYRQIIEVAGQISDFSTLARYENEAAAYLVKNDPEMGDWVKFRITEIYFNEGQKAMAEKPYPQGVDLLKKAAEWNTKGLGKYQDRFNNKTIELMINASKFWNGDGKKLIASAAPYKFSIIALQSFDGIIVDEGKKDNAKYELSPEMEQSIPAAFEVFRQMYFYMTGGRMLAEMKYTEVTNILTEVDVSYWKPSEEAKLKPGKGIPMYAALWKSIMPFPSDIISNEMKNSDTLVMVFPFFCTAGTSSLVYYKDASLPKGYTAHGFIQIPKDASPFSYGLLLHEFFHYVEFTYRDKYHFIAHVYSDAYKAYWPAWYKGEGEAFYQNHILHEMMEKYGIGLLLNK